MIHPSSGGRISPRWLSVLFCVLLVVATSRFAMAARSFEEVRSYVLYQAGTLAFNYFQFGAVRRGLGGSIAYLLSRDAVAATIAFHFLSAACVAATAAWLLRRLQAPAVTRGVFALTMLIIVLRWGDDAGRTDMAVAALLGGATIAFARGRVAIAAACVATGLFIHESSFVFGLPLLLALALQTGWARITPRQRLAAAAVLGAALLLYLSLDALPHAARRDIVQVIRGRLPVHEHVDWALYFALSGLRGVRASICQNLTDPSYWVHPVSGLIVIGFACAALVPRPRANLAWALLATLPGFVFLSVVANDMSRWAMFACFNVWLVAISAPSAEPSSRPSRWLRLAIAAAMFPLVLLRPWPIEFRIYAPSPWIESKVRWYGGPRTPSVEEALERCDPHWNDVIYQP
jgi:hypothetical protein